MINAISFLLSPLSCFTSVVNEALLSALGVSSSDDVVTQPELRMMLSSASEAGEVQVYEQDMIEGVRASLPWRAACGPWHTRRLTPVASHPSPHTRRLTPVASCSSLGVRRFSTYRTREWRRS